MSPEMGNKIVARVVAVILLMRHSLEIFAGRSIVRVLLRQWCHGTRGGQRTLVRRCGGAGHVLEAVAVPAAAIVIT